MSVKNNNMWVFGLVLYIATTVALSTAQVTDPYNKLADHWFNKCNNETKQTLAFDKLYSNSVEFKRYLKYTFKFIPGEKKIFCDRERDILKTRMKELAKDMRPCLPQKEKFFEQFIYDSFNEILHFLCHNNGEHIDAFFSARSSECRNRLFNTENPNLGNCFSGIFRPASGLTKKDLCADYGVVKKCFAEALALNCPADGGYKKLNEDFFSYASKPCSGCAFYLNSLLLTVSILVSYIFSRK
ncbi:uncharacterized protein [Diabrotica undecimpunctata]|uniref:uncharacterized protein n=1 Tax=Diabrotica undecimpunctata TaxID=50387 RepID=UPI003B640530